MQNTSPFPKSIGFGYLDPSSIVSDGDSRLGDYYCLEQRVHQVKLYANGKAMITDYYKQESLTISGGKDLNTCIQHHYLCWQPTTHAFMQYYMEQVCRLGNIYFEQINTSKRRIVYVPAGHLFMLYLPVNHDSTKAIANISSESKLFPLYYNTYSSQVTTYLKNNEVRTEKIALMCMVVSMAEVYDFCKEMVDCNIILPQERFRLMIREVSSAYGEQLLTFRGREEDKWSHYSIPLKQWPMKAV